MNSSVKNIPLAMVHHTHLKKSSENHHRQIQSHDKRWLVLTALRKIQQIVFLLRISIQSQLLSYSIHQTIA